MDIVDVPEHRGDPGENADLCFHPSRTARSTADLQLSASSTLRNQGEKSENRRSI
jgi:hypothetical protein